MNRHDWTLEETHILRELYPDYRAQDVADALGVSLRSVYIKANALGLKDGIAPRWNQDFIRVAHRLLVLR